MTRPCAHCRKPLRDGERFRTLIANVRPMLACPRCKARIDGGRDFKVETNFRARGTSAEAAALAAKRAEIGKTHERILQALMVKPMTADEIAKELGLVLNTARARIADLKRAGVVEPTGERRETDAKGMADVIHVVEQGRVAA